MINVMQTEERSASVTHSVQNLRWLPHHCTTDNSGQRGNAACGYTNCILAMLTLHNAKISFPRRDLVRWYRWDACCFARQQVNNNTQTDNDNTHGTATPTWHVRINQHANTVKDPALRRYETRNNKLNGYPTTLKWIIQRTLVDIQLKLGGSKWILSGSKWIQNLQDPFRSDPFTSLPFGLTGAPATFQRYINHTLREYLDEFVSAYLDDILIYTDGSLADHRHKVKLVLQKLQEAGLQLDVDKCEFECQSVKYLGFIIEVGKGIRMDPEKVAAIQNWEAPKTVKGVRSFLGFANYYRLFIANFADIARPLTDLMKKGQKFNWDDKAQRAFEDLKQRFISDPILATFDPDRETVVETDASSWATGGVLSQYDDNGDLRPCAYYSKKNLPAECNYEIHDKELLAVIRCLEEWDAELRSVKSFTILTDHKNLEYFMKIKRLNERQMRWAEILARYCYRLSYRPGKLATRPDALSRREQDVPEGQEDDRLQHRNKQLLKPAIEVRTTDASSDGSSNIDTPDIADEPNNDTAGDQNTPFMDPDLQALWTTAMEQDENFEKIRKAVVDGLRKFPKELKLQVSIAECDIDPLRRLRYRERIWIPAYEPLRTELIQQTHDSMLTGHPGRDATLATLSRRFFWPGISQDVRKFCNNCDVCGRVTTWRDKRWGLLKPLPIPNRIWREISMDFIVGLPPARGSGETNCLVIVDRFSKGVMFEPISDMSAEGTANVFIKLFYRHHGLPSAITSDRGSQWVNAFWKRVCQLLKIERRLSTAYHPETDGSTEQKNQVLEAYLSAFVAYTQDDWAEHLPSAELAINNRNATSTGISSFFMTHGVKRQVFLALIPGPQPLVLFL